jgi:hypothetical protein
VSAPDGAAGLTAGGLVFLLLAWGAILAATAFCLMRLFRTRGGKG